MGTLSDNYTENVRLFDEALGVGRSVDMVSRNYVIGGRRAGFGWWTAMDWTKP